jgi:hypothetical protein
LPFLAFFFIFFTTTDFGTRKSAVIVRSNFSRSLEVFLLMAKHKVPRRIRDRERQLNMQVTQSTPEKRFKVLPRLEKIVGWILGILTVAGFFLNYIPKLSVDTSGSLRPQDPMGTVFYLSNDGLFAVHDVFANCYFVRIEGAVDLYNFKIALPSSRAKILSPGHKMTLPCAHAVASEAGAVTNAEITLLVDYRPDWIWWHKHTEFPMRAEKIENGTWLWKYIPK